MQMNQIQDSLNRIEQCTDQAASAAPVERTDAPTCAAVSTTIALQARQVRDMAQQSNDQGQLTSRIDQLEQAGDRAKQACQRAGNAVDSQLQSAVMQAHDEISNLKKQMHWRCSGAQPFSGAPDRFHVPRRVAKARIHGTVAVDGLLCELHAASMHAVAGERDQSATVSTSGGIAPLATIARSVCAVAARRASAALA